VKEWTTGDAHDVTDRSFVVRRVLRINYELPGEKTTAGNHWVWQHGPWLMVDRVNGHVTALKLPDYDPGVSQVSWFRDYAAYCGVTAKRQEPVRGGCAAWREPVLAKKLSAFERGDSGEAVCAPVEWQREPLRTTFHPAGKEAVSFDVVPGSAVLVEDSDDSAEPASPRRRTELDRCGLHHTEYCAKLDVDD